MNTAVQIPGNLSPGIPQLNSSTAAPIVSRGQQFSVLLNMLASLATYQNVTNQVQLPDLSGGPAADLTQKVRGQSGSASSSDIQLSGVEEQLFKDLSIGMPAASKQQPKKDIESPAVNYLAVGLPFVTSIANPSDPKIGPGQAPQSQDSKGQITTLNTTELQKEIEALLTGTQTAADVILANEGRTDGGTVNATLVAQPPGPKTQQPKPPSDPRVDDAKTALSKQLAASLDNGTIDADLIKKFQADASSMLPDGSGTSASRPQLQTTTDLHVIQPRVSPQSFSDGTIPPMLKSGPSVVAQNATQSITDAIAEQNPVIPTIANTQSAAPASQANMSAQHVATQTAASLENPMKVTSPQANNSDPNQDNRKSQDSGNLDPDIIRQLASQANAASDPKNTDAPFARELSVAAGSQAAQPARPEPSQIAQSIVKEVAMMSREGKTVVNMKLQPEDMGTVMLRVSSQDGKISAEFNVKNADARAYLETTIPEMRQALQTNGISLSHLSVNLSAGDSNNRRPQYQTKKQQQKYFADMSPEHVEAIRSFGYNTIELKV